MQPPYFLRRGEGTRGEGNKAAAMEAICSQVTQITYKSWFVFVCVTIQSWLWLAVCKWCKIQETHTHTFFKNKNQYILAEPHSGKLYPFKETCSFKEHVFVQVQGRMFIQGNYIYWTMLYSRNSRNIYSKIVPSHFIIIISFTITISWIKYSCNFFRLKDEEIVDMIEGSVL